MNIFKTLLICLMATMLFSTAKSMTSNYQYIQDKKIIINGTIQGDTKGKNKVFITDLNAYRDTTVVKEGKFSFKSPFDSQKTLFINFECEMGYRPYTIVYDQPGAVNIVLDLQGNELSMSGMETPVIYNEFRLKEGEIYRAIDKELSKKYSTAYPKQGDANYNSAMLDRKQLYDKKIIALLKEQTAKYPGAYASAYTLADRTARYPLVLQEELYGILNAKAKATTKGKELYAMIQGTKNSATGSQVADFVLADTAGNPVAFSKFKGKYLLIDFWASWCGPCRAAFPKMRELYKKYQAKGLEIYSISVDVDKKNWLTAVIQEKLPWQQAIDNGTVAKHNFAVASIPNLFLISPEGKIILEELGTDPKSAGPIEKKLEEVFKEK